MCKKVWCGAMKMRSFRMVVLLFAKYFYKFGDYRAVKELTKDYVHVDVHRAHQMLVTLGIIKVTDKIEYDIDVLSEIIQHVEDDTA